jgi:glycosyltransferase involved in cell wall biosynthesis
VYFGGKLKVSLVVPVKNEADTIERLIASAAAQTRRPDEIVIVDGGSRDGTTEIVEQWAAKRSLSDWVRVVRTENATPGKGRNIGVVNAKYDWIAFTDAGIRVEHFWLDRLVEVAEREPEVDVVYGSYEPVVETFFDRCAALAFVPAKQVREGQLMRGPCVPSSLIRKKVWEGVGGFPDLRAAEDLIFMEAIERKGFKIGWAPRALIWWRMPNTLARTFYRFASFSMHNAKIGRQADWHYGIARQYLIGLLLALLGFVIHESFFLVPAVGYGLRVAKSIWTKRESRGLLWTLNPLQFLGVMGVLLTTDLATFAGWIFAWFDKRPIFLEHLLQLSVQRMNRNK